MKITALIVDDEARARRVLLKLIEEFCPEVDVIGEASNVPEAATFIKQKLPQLIFLDIEMPEYDGFQLFDFLPADIVDSRYFVFTTAYNEHAIQAFKVNATDYLLKPIKINELIKCCQKIQQLITRSKEATTISPSDNISKVALPVSDGILFVDSMDIVHVEADGSYTNIFMIDGREILVSKRLKEIEKLLKGSYFFKTHRSYIINLHYVKQFIKQDGGYIMMSNGSSVSIVRDKKEAFIEAMQSVSS